MDISLYRMIPPQVRDSVFVNSVSLMNVISHEIEDVVINNGLQVDFYAGFQRFSYFARQLRRYRRLAQVCRRVYVWGVPDIEPPPIPGVEYISVTPTMDLAREWFLVVDSPQFYSALLTQELTYGQELPKGQRRFQGIWTYDPDIVGRAYLLLSQVLGQDFRPVLQRSYETQNRYLVQISNRLVQRQDAIDQALQRSTILQAGLDVSETPTLLLDVTQHVISANTTAASILQAAPEHLIGQQFAQCANGLFADLKLSPDEPAHMVPLRSSGSGPLALSSTPVNARNGQFIGWVVTLHASAELHEQARQQRGVVLPIAPMLQKYLGGIQQLLMMMPSLVARQDVQLRVVSQMQRMVGEMNTQVQRLKLLQDLESQTSMVTTAVSLDQLFGQLIAEFRQRASENNLMLHADLPAALPALLCNGEQLRLALHELLDNALTHAPAGSTVQMRAERHGAELRLSVHDSGPGIEPAHQAHIFEPFYRSNGTVEASPNGTNTGLGLALARAVTRIHGGQISVESRSGQGSIFTLILPYNQV